MTNLATRKFTTDMLNDPWFIGFDRLMNRLVEADGNRFTNYPPYNLIKTGEDSYIVEMALAGFDEEDLTVEVHDGVLSVSANIGTSDDETDYIHRGIAARSFTRKFTLADTVEIEGAFLNQGILTIQLRNVIPEEKKPKLIPINFGKNTKKSLLRG